MTTRDKNRLTEYVLYILNSTKGSDAYHIFKILYFAEMKHLVKWGQGMVPDTFHAFENGPVPFELYNALKSMSDGNVELVSNLAEVIRSADEDANNILLANREYNGKFISKAAKAALDESIMENKDLSFDELRTKSHDSAWQEARDKVNGTDEIYPVSMAKVMGADDALLEYIEDQLDLRFA